MRGGQKITEKNLLLWNKETAHHCKKRQYETDLFLNTVFGEYRLVILMNVPYFGFISSFLIIRVW